MLKLALFVFAISTLPAAAHPGHGATDAAAGFLHPLTGLDHVMAMLSVGAWSALIGGTRIWLWPLAFVSAMVLGGELAHLGVAIPFVEQGIATSLVVIGVFLALAVNAPVWSGAALIAAFALFHGHAHGTEAAGAEWLPYMAGFAAATASLHLGGISIARGLISAFSAVPVRLIGAASAATGIALLIT